MNATRVDLLKQLYTSLRLLSESARSAANNVEEFYPLCSKRYWEFVESVECDVSVVEGLLNRETNYGYEKDKA